MTDTQRQITILKRILHSSDKEIHDINFLLENIKEYGIVPLAWLKELDDEAVYTDNGMMQVPGEFAGFCQFLADQEVHTAMEVGVYRGRSSYFICAVLYRNNSDLVYDMVDIVDSLDEFKEFQKILPCIRKQIPHTTKDFVGKEYDFVFIDADHSYEASMEDYLNVGRYAKKMVCFHDIYAHEYDSQGGGIVRTWNEVGTITTKLPKMVFSQFPNRWMGIGVISNSKGCGTIGRLGDFESVMAERDTFVREIQRFDTLYVYGARNDSRRMYRALRQQGYAVEGLLISEEDENPEQVLELPVCYLRNIAVDDATGIVVCYRRSLCHTALEHLTEHREHVVICDDIIASFLTK
ncbi:MAG: class I SAM-dependent methyltransferase [Lachnospiraceae bacterium]|nr:class I SAM-dependent methyltransferase [Lachnospiraceae bacterium]